MSDWKRIENIDASILDRITEDEVTMWIAARLQQIRENLPQASCLGVNVHRFNFCHDPHISADWGMHAADKCSGTSPSVAAALKAVRDELMDHPAKRAAEARRKAKDLLEEAAEIEALPVG